MITRVEISGYKSLSEVALDLRPLSVIVGPNASGKSNLFDALRLLSAMATQPDLKAAFDTHRGIPIEAFFAENGIAKLLDEERLQFSISVNVRLSEHAITATERLIRDLREGLQARPDKRHVTQLYLRYSLTVEFLPRTGVLRVADERLEALRKNGSVRQSRNPFFERGGDRLSLRMEGQGRPTMIDVGMPYTIISQPLYAPHYPHITAFREELRRWRFYYFDPAVMRESTPLREVDTIGQNGQDMAGYFYSMKMRNQRQFDTLSRALREIVPAVSGMEIERTPKGFVELSVHENSAAYSARVMSEGTLRVLGILAILSSDTNNTTIGFEEPENGVHPRRIELVAKLFNGASSNERQLLVTTHSPVLPTYFEDTALIVASRQGSESEFRSYRASLGPMSKRADMETALEERILRGDFGG